MVLGNQSSTRPDHFDLSVHPAAGGVASNREDRVLAVRHQTEVVAPRRLRAGQRAVLQVLVSHLLPAGDDASVLPDSVVQYIDYLIANEFGGTEVPLTLGEVYGQGCDLVQEHACRVYGRQVQTLTFDERDRLVWDLLECSMDGFDRFSPSYFFHTLRQHIADAMQGAAITPNHDDSLKESEHRMT